MNDALDHKEEKAPSDVDTAIQRMQEARDRHTLVRRGNCYCPKKTTS
jgi:hypothetical protein